MWWRVREANRGCRCGCGAEWLWVPGVHAGSKYLAMSWITGTLFVSFVFLCPATTLGCRRCCRPRLYFLVGLCLGCRGKRDYKATGQEEEGEESGEKGLRRREGGRYIRGVGSSLFSSGRVKSRHCQLCSHNLKQIVPLQVFIYIPISPIP